MAEVVFYPVIAVGLTTMALFGLLAFYPELRLAPTVYLVPVVICAIRWGLGSALVGITASALLWDYLLVQPLYSFIIEDPNQIVELVLFGFVAVITSKLAAAAKSEAEACRRRETDVRNLVEFSRRVARCSTAAELVEAIQEYLSVHLGCVAHLIHPPREVEAHSLDAEGLHVHEMIVREAGEMIATQVTGSRLVTDPETKCRWVLKVIASDGVEHGVLAVNLRTDATPGTGERVESLLREGIATLSRIDAAGALARANVRAQSEALRTALIGTASHELRSPIAAILGSVSVLDTMPALRANEQIRALVNGMHREAKRLDADIQNLLATVRIGDSGIEPQLVWTDPADCLSAAIRQRADRIATHRVTVEIDAELPLLQLDPVLLEQAAGQIIENAAKYSPADSEIAIVAGQQRGEVVFSVADHGVGLTSEEASQLFRCGMRGRRHVGKVPGLGLGLWIAWTFARANGGRMSAYSAGPGLGTIVSIRLPVPRTENLAAAAIDGQAS